MRRTDTPELKVGDRAPENGVLTSAPAVMRRWAPLEAPTPLYISPRLLPGGLAPAIVFDTSRTSGARAGMASPEPGFGRGEDGARTAHRPVLHSLDLPVKGDRTGIRELSAEENEETVEARSPRYHAA